MENMAAAELFTFHDITQANATLKLLLLSGLNIFKSPKLVNKLSPFIKLHEAFSQTCQIIDDFA